MKRRAMAIVSVLLVSGVILTFVLGGLSLASQHLFQVSALHNRHRALYAAEIGVNRARYQLEQNTAYAGSDSGSTSDESRWNYSVTRQGSKATVVSTGIASGQRQVLRVTLTLEADSFNGLCSEGPIRILSHGYVNGIRSLADPRSSKGNVHTNASGDAYNVEAGKRFFVNHQYTTPGAVNGTVEGIFGNNGQISTPSFTHASLTSVSFGSNSIPGNGDVTANTRVNGNVEMTSPLNIPAGVTVYITGDAVLHGGVVGEGTLVVDGHTLLRARASLRDNTPRGVLLYGRGDVVLAHPTAYVDTDEPGGMVVQQNGVGDLFAQMPEEIPYLLSQRLPPGAPAHVGFFEWYQQQLSNPSPAFLEWRDGDGTNLNPGLSTEVKQWLAQAAAMNNQIENQAGPMVLPIPVPPPLPPQITPPIQVTPTPGIAPILPTATPQPAII